jgi:hypothetical protein
MLIQQLLGVPSSPAESWIGSVLDIAEKRKGRDEARPLSD